MVNSRNVDELADYIEREERLPFAMVYGLRPAPPDAEHACGTAGCIGGFSAALWPELYAEQAPAAVCEFNETLLAIKLGIEGRKIADLCFPGDLGTRYADEDEEIAYRELTRKGAVKTLRRLASMGEVQWLKCEQI